VGLGAAFFSSFLPLVIIKHIQYDQHHGCNQKKDLEKLDHGCGLLPAKVNSLPQTVKFLINRFRIDVSGTTKVAGASGRPA